MRNPSPTRITLGAIQPVKNRSQKRFQERRPLPRWSRIARSTDRRAPPSSPKTSAGLFSTASRHTSSVCHIEEGEASPNRL